MRRDDQKRARQRLAFIREADRPCEDGTVIACPSRVAVLDECVAQHIGNYPTTVRAIWDDVLHDYGSVTLRTVHRVLRRLEARREIVRVGLISTKGAYVSSKSPLLADYRSLIDLVEDQFDYAASDASINALVAQCDEILRERDKARRAF